MADQHRRDFIRHGLLGLAALPLSTGLLANSAQAEELPRLDPDSPQAKSLGYVTNIAKAKDNPTYQAGEHCANCMFFKQANNGCQVFPQYSVVPDGWCQSWTKQAD